MGALRVLLADDHRLMLRGVRTALEEAEDIEIVGEARTGSQVPPLVSQLEPEVVLLDVRLPELDGLACLALLRKRYPDVKVVMLSMYYDPDHVEGALKRGASGYIVKSINPGELPSALRQAVEGSEYQVLGTPESDEQTAAASKAGLTEREICILRAVARGLSNRAIGRELWVAEQTVKFHLTNVYRKLNVVNRTEAAGAAHRLGLIESPIPAEAGAPSGSF